MSVQRVAGGDDEDGVPVCAAGPRVSRIAQAVGYAIDPERHLSPTPPTPVDAVAGVVDRSAFLSLA
jgi:hypothetical protein